LAPLFRLDNLKSFIISDDFCLLAGGFPKLKKDLGFPDLHLSLEDLAVEGAYIRVMTRIVVVGLYYSRIYPG